MREDNLITEPIRFLTILELETKEEINDHGYARLVGYISDEVEEEYLSLLMGELWERVELVGKEGEHSILFQGLVTDFCIDQINDQKKLTLVLRSGTWLMEEEKHFRSWQNEGMVFREIFQEICSFYPGQAVRFSQPYEEKIKELVLQHEDTDWNFLKRVSARKNSFLVADCRREGCRLYYDLPKGREVSFLPEGKYRIIKDLEAYRKKKKNGLFSLAESDCLTYELESRENHRIGDYLAVQGRTFYLYRIEGDYQGGQMIYLYRFMQKKGLSVLPYGEEEYVGCSLKAKVMGVKEDRVQVRLMGDERENQNITLWHPYATVYSTPDGTGWYCMPEIGDEVRLTIPGKEEKEAYVTSSVHLDTDNEERKNPEEKVLKTKYQKEIRFTPDSLVITNNQGNRIELRDKEGIQIVSAGALSLEATKEVTLSSDSGSLLIAGASTVSLKQGGTSIQLEEGISFIGGELKVQ